MTRSGAFLLRVPLLPVDATVEEVIELPAIRAALELADPGIGAELDRLETTGICEDEAGLQVRLRKAVVRLSTRPTPFALSAGVGVGVGTERTAATLTAPGALQFHWVPNGLADWQALVETPHERRTFVANPSLYRTGDAARYLELIAGRTESTWRFELQSTPWSELLELTLVACAAPARHDTVVDAIAAEGYDPEAARRWIASLVDNGVLVDAEWTGLGAPLHDRLPSGSSVADAASAHRALVTLHQRWQPEQLLDEPLRAGLLERSVQALQSSAPLQAQLSVAQDSGISMEDRRSIWTGVELLWRLQLAPTTWSDTVAQALETRFEGTPRPLLELLDPELGLPESVTAEPLAPRRSLEDPLQQWLLQKVVDSPGELAISLDGAPLPSVPHAMPPVVTAMVSIAADGRSHLIGAQGRAWVSLLARFWREEGVLELITELAALEDKLAEEEGVVLAEINHVPMPNLEALVKHPALYRHELQVAHAAHSEHAISPTDLVLGLRNRIPTLWSRSRGLEVGPRLTSAYNFHRSSDPRLFRFLALMARMTPYQERLGWDWGSLDTLRFLPRVQSGRVVLAKASWLLDASEVAALADVAARHALRDRLQLPRQVCVRGTDGNESLFDLTDDWSSASLARALRRTPVARVSEVFPVDDELLVTDGRGRRHRSEILLPFVQDRRPSVPARERIELPSGTQRFLPGDQWSYLKIYAAPRVTHRLAVELGRELHADPQVQKWFFVRYADPEPHLRLRFLGGDRDAVLRSLDRPEIWRVAADTYVRELVRYVHMEAAESVFHRDSVAAISDESGELVPAARAARAARRLLQGLRVPEAAQRDIVRALKQQSAARLGREHESRIAEDYRRHRAVLEEALTLDDDWGPVAEEWWAAWDGDLDAMRPVLASLVHMACNRVLDLSGGVEELAAMGWLDRYLTSRMARGG